MPDDPKIPEGFKVERTAAGGFRFDLPRPAGAIIGAVAAVPFMCVWYGMLVWFFRDGVLSPKEPWQLRLFLSLFMIPFWVVPLWGLYGALRAALGRRALEVDDRAITNCVRLPPLPESRKPIALEDVTALAVDELRGSKGGVTRYLAVRTAGKEHRLAEGLDSEALEWLAARVAMLADRARGGAAAAGGKTLAGTLAADLRCDRIEAGEAGPEDLARTDVGEAPPEDSGIDVLESGRDRLAVRLAGRGGGFFLFFAVMWLGLIGLFTAIMALVALGAIRGKVHGDSPLYAFLFLLPFWAIGIGMLLVGLRQRTLVERLEFRPGSVSWEARSVLGTSARALEGDLQLSEAESYRQNNRPVYHLRVTAPDGRKIKFAGNLKREAQVWLMARIAAVLALTRAVR
jgi:hypothetical protein